MILSSLISSKRISLKSLFQHMDEMVFLIKVEGDQYRCVEVNQAYLDNTGFIEDEIVNKTVREVLEHQEAERVCGRYDEVITSGKTSFYEESVTLNGERKTYETTLIPLNIENNKRSYILGFSRDISDRKNYEEELLRTKEQLNQVIHHQQGVIFSVGKVKDEYIYTLFDGQVLNQIELTSKQIVGRRPHDFWEKRLADSISSFYDQSWSTQEKIIFEETFSKESVWLTVLNPVVEHGVTTALIGFSLDITKRKVAEKALMNNEKLSLIGELSAGIGHEINNPLTSVKGFVQIMKENNQYMTPEILKIMENEIETIERFSEELIMLARPQDHQKSSFDVLSLLRETAGLVYEKPAEKNVTIEIIPSDGEFLVNGVRKQIKQALFNILENAVESMEFKNEGTILIKNEIADDKLVISVIDTGCGIEEERLSSLGEPFYTTKTRGNGLGLMISKKIIKNHKGELKIESQLNKGTTVTVCLPVV